MVGDIKYRDLNGDGRIDTDDQTMLSSYGTTPRLQYGFGATVNWKRWDFGFFFTGSAKRKIMINNMQPFSAHGWGGSPRNVMQWVVDNHFDPELNNFDAEFPRMGLGTNDFANSLKIPKNMLQAADVVVNGRTFACDVGKFNYNIFIYVAAFGIFTDVSYGTPQDTKNVLGHAAYLIEGVKLLPAVRSYPLKITCNEEVIEGEFLYGMVTNSHSVGGFRGITGKNVALDDGLFEVTLIRKPTNPLDLNNIIRALVDKRVKSEYIYTFTTEKLKVESEDPVAWTLDGEFGGEHRAVTIESWHQALEIRVPEDEE